MGNITVLGAGAWGTALATLLAKNGNDVLLWSFEKKVCADINENNKNECYLPGVELPTNLKATSDLQEACQHSEILIEVIPVKFLRKVLLQAKPFINKNHRFVATSKGIEEKTLFLPIDIVKEIFGKGCRAAVLGGPNFAHDVAIGGFSATTIASADKSFCSQLSAIFANDMFRVGCSEDVVGVQVAGALKNVIALAVGIACGAGLSESTIACIITRGLEEMCKVSQALGGKIETIYSYPGVGDLILTATNEQSRNFRAGKMLGQCVSVADIEKKFPALPEGINSAPSVVALANKIGTQKKNHNVIPGLTRNPADNGCSATGKLSLPICQAVNNLIKSECDVKSFVKTVTY
ncbi:NAD(P)-dependent glycerol-3-phosphate dehydrogenase [Candidatus Babeliales bacterium]|nr:NAD(P)-dependent glycerol-3-phosphate dehydrogenase [Candidatus Babeliales bacterium]